MADGEAPTHYSGHSHVFLGEGHERAERRTWAVIWLCGAMMAIEIVGGLMFGSIALVADGLHMSTHAGALLLAALAYRYARKLSHDARFTFGTGKMGDLAGFSSAIVLAMIALLIGYEAVCRLFAPVPIHFAEALPIACLGLVVNIGSVWLLSGGGNDHHGRGHGHGHGHSHGHNHGHGHAHGHGGHDDHDDKRRIDTAEGALLLSVFEDGVPPRFRVEAERGASPSGLRVVTERPDGSRQVFEMADRGSYVESIDELPEPHAFSARIVLADTQASQTEPVIFEEHEHGAAAGRDNNMRAAVVHVMADAAVSVLVIIGLLLARTFGWLWMDPLAGLVGAFVISSWSYGLLRDTGAILLDMNPDRAMADKVRRAIEVEGDRLADLHLWRLGPGHLGAILSVATASGRNQQHYRERLGHFASLSHLTIQVERLGERA